uniref:3',5'-cyclic-GMP phosphodiesterase n=1 Tax=Cyprinus carpio TaxID=7962 RepID=A0A8C1QH57_CYPCA
MSPSLKQAARLPHGPQRPAVPTRARPSSNRGQHGNSRANRPKRVSLGTNSFYAFIIYLFIWIFYGYACCICANVNVVILRFGEEIPGMEGLGTDFNVICPWEAYSHLELHELAQYGII